MLPSFEMSVPADARYRVLGPEVAARYAALAGCPAGDVEAVLAEVDRAAADVAGAGEDLTLVFGVADGALQVTLAAAGRAVTVRRTLPAGA